MNTYRTYLSALTAAAAILGLAIISPASAARRPSLKQAYKQATILTINECYDRELAISGTLVVKCHRPIPPPNCLPVPTHPTVLCSMGFYLQNLTPGAKRPWQACGTYVFFERQGRKTVQAPPFDGWECVATNTPPPGTPGPPVTNAERSA